MKRHRRPSPRSRVRQLPETTPPPTTDGLMLDLLREEPLAPDDRRMAEQVLEAWVHGDRRAVETLPGEAKEVLLRIHRELEAVGTSPLADLVWRIDYDWRPVPLDTFLEDPYYLGAVGQRLYPAWRRELQLVLDPTRGIVEWIITGAIGTGKTTAAIIAQVYKLYRLTCLRSPQGYHGLMEGSTIVFGLFNATLNLAQDVSYRKFLTVLRGSPYFRDLAQIPTRRRTTRVDLPKHLTCAFGSDVLHALGQEIYGGILSEVNFSRAATAQPVIELYTGVQRRMASRFLRPDGPAVVPGLLVIDSSRRTESDWLEAHLKASADDSSVHVTTFALWDVKPFSGPTFRIRLGDRTHRSEILPADVPLDETGRGIDVPLKLLGAFQADLEGALKDIAGVAIYAEWPLLTDPGKAEACVDPTRAHPFSVESVVLSVDRPDQVKDFLLVEQLFEPYDVYSGRPYRLRVDPTTPRYLHVDLALTGDCAAIAMCHPSGTRWVTHFGSDGIPVKAPAPLFMIDFILRLRPRRGAAIDFGKIRGFILMLRAMGVTIEQVSFDRFQSADSRQILEKEGIPTAEISVDRSPDAYFALRDAINEARISYYRYAPFLEEITTVQWDHTRKKVDHGPGRSKDCADAVAGALFAATTAEASSASPLPPLAGPHGASAFEDADPRNFPSWVVSDYPNADLITGIER